MSKKGWRSELTVNHLAPVDKKLGSAIHRINRYPADNHDGNQIALV